MKIFAIILTIMTLVYAGAVYAVISSTPRPNKSTEQMLAVLKIETPILTEKHDYTIPMPQWLASSINDQVTSNPIVQASLRIQTINTTARRDDGTAFVNAPPEYYQH